MENDFERAELNWYRQEYFRLLDELVKSQQALAAHKGQIDDFRSEVRAALDRAKKYDENE